jgi:predicted RNase H-like HicB family nuclease
MSTPTVVDPKAYDVLLEPQQDGTYQASVLGWNNCTVIADTEQEAITKVQAALSDRMAKAKIIQVEAPQPAYSHPWMQFAQRLSQNPLLDEVDQYIAEARLNQAAEDAT